MLRQQSNKNILYINCRITTAIPVVVMSFFIYALFSCTGRMKEVGDAITERDSLSAMTTLGVTSFVSDSGITRYKIITEEWLVFDRKNPPFWAFEKGVYLEKFDSIFQVEASIKADTAYFFEKEKLWKLIGNVEIQNQKDERFETELLYWNQNTGRVYSDKKIRIEQIDRITIGQGFESDQEMINYRIRNMEGIYYFDESAESPMPADSING